MVAHSRYLRPTEPCSDLPTLLNLSYRGWWHQWWRSRWSFVDKTYTLAWSKIEMLVLPQSIFSRFSSSPTSLHFPPVQPSGWAVKQETGAKSKFWCLDRTKGDLCGWAEHWVRCCCCFKLLALLPTRLALCVKARPSHHCCYSTITMYKPQRK